MIKSRKISSGNYEVTNGVRTVSVIRVEPNKAYGDTHDMWVAAADWTNTIYTDPLDTKREAMRNAINMLSE